MGVQPTDSDSDPKGGGVGRKTTEIAGGLLRLLDGRVGPVPPPPPRTLSPAPPNKSPLTYKKESDGDPVVTKRAGGLFLTSDLEPPSPNGEVVPLGL